MARQRSRLRFIRTVPAAGSDYGSNTYGDSTYGERGTDSAEYSDYRIVPVGESIDELPWQRRQWDAGLVAFRLLAFGYTDDDIDGVAMDVSTLDEAWLRLDRVSGGPPIAVSLPLTIVPPDVLSNAGDPDEVTDIEAGTYRLMILLRFQSGRRLTVPGDDSNLVRFSDRVAYGGP